MQVCFGHWLWNKIVFDTTETMEKRRVKIKKVPVELYKILKFENIAYSGGEAKHMIADCQVSVNGEIETQKRKKIYPGDQILCFDILLEIVS